MREKLAVKLRGAGKALRYGAIVALALGAVAFVFALLANGFSVVAGLDWARRLLYVMGALCLIVGGAGLCFSGDRLRDERAEVKPDEVLRSFEHAVGISWATAFCVASLDFFVLGAVAELLFFLLVG